jgi:hypothetical protein
MNGHLKYKLLAAPHGMELRAPCVLQKQEHVSPAVIKVSMEILVLLVSTQTDQVDMVIHTTSDMNVILGTPLHTMDNLALDIEGMAL